MTTTTTNNPRTSGEWLHAGSIDGGASEEEALLDPAELVAIHTAYGEHLSAIRGDALAGDTGAIIARCDLLGAGARAAPAPVGTLDDIDWHDDWHDDWEPFWKRLLREYDAISHDLDGPQ